MKICKVHGNSIEHKSGVSKKTNKPYSFDACTIKNADGSYCTAEIIEQEEKAGQTSIPEETREPIGDEIWAAKDRMNMAQSAIKASAEIVGKLIEQGNQEVARNARLFTKSFADELYKWIEDKKQGKVSELLTEGTEVPF